MFLLFKHTMKITSCPKLIVDKFYVKLLFVFVQVSKTVIFVFRIL